MYNYYYKVFVGQSSRPTTYTIKKRVDNPDKKEKTKLMLIWSIVLTILMFGVVISVSIIDNKRKSILQESLYEKLLRLCNPANYLKQYDREKVDKANSIYKRLLSVDPGDAEGIKALEIEATSSLGISLIDAERLKELKDAVNPKRFLKPYDAERFTKANDLYSRLLKEDLSLDELVEIEAASKEL